MASNAAFTLDKSIFNKIVECISIRVPTRHTEHITKALRDQLVTEYNKVRPVQKKDDDSAHRYVLLKTSAVASDGTLNAAVRAVVDDVLTRFPHTADCCPSVATASAEATALQHVVKWPLQLGYDNLTTDQILRALLPASITEIPSSFESIGHVAHLNLKDEQLPYKHVIGTVILDKNPTIKTVVNKTASIETKFRTFPMELLAGDPNTRVELRHCGATFRFDFKTVYWNTRLQQEHEHMVTHVVKPGALVADVFCGVGPFAIPLGSRGCTVHANDLNPASHAALQENVKRNKVQGGVTCYNMDGRAFIMHMGASGVPFEVALMNLPADALTFLDAFVGLWRHPKKPSADGDAAGAGAASGASTASSSATQTFVARPLPVVHCYCFSKAETETGAADDVASRAMHALGLVPPTSEQAAAYWGATSAYKGSDPAQTGAGGAGCIDSTVIRAARSMPGLLPDLSVRSVRDVAPRKLMLCVSFTLPRAVAEAAPVVTWEGLAEAEARERAEEEAALAQAGAGSAGEAAAISGAAVAVREDGNADSSSQASASSQPALKRARME